MKKSTRQRPPRATARQATTKEARRTRVAAALVEGKSVTQIARQERVSRSTASKQANSPEVQLLITALVEAERVQIRSLFQQALKAVEDSFAANRTAVYEGGTVDLGADHYARLTGVKCLTQLLTAGRQAVKPEPPSAKTFTLDQLKTAVAQAAGRLQ